MKKMRISALALAIILVTPAAAFAEGFALYDWSARGVALGGAVMARKADPSVISANPAAITGLSGAQVQAGVSLIMPRGKMQFDNGETTSVKNDVWPIPSAYYTQQVTDRFFLGVGAFSRFGLGFEYPDNWPGRYNIYETSVETFSLNPNVAYKVTDKLSLAAGVEIMHADITLKKKQPGGMPPNPATDIDFDTSTKNWEFGWNLAMHYQFNEQWAFGLGYRSKVTHDIDGELKVDPAIPQVGVRNQDFTASVNMPESISFGLAFSPIPKLSFEAGAIWTHWSQFTDLDFDFEYLNKVENKKYWNNAWRLNLGVEYALNDWVDLRAGYVWDQSPVPNSREDYLIPTDGRNIYSLGVGFKPRNWTIDLAYGFVDAQERVYQARSDNSGVMNSKTKDSYSHILSMSVGYKF